jgi:formylglycine-generating enzyme required for sulfatase activity
VKVGERVETKTAAAKVVCTDLQTDLALLKIDPQAPLRAVRLAVGGDVQSGERVTVIGNPGLGNTILDYTVTEGIVSNPRRSLEGQTYLQTSAAINPGCSGGPMFGGDGLVIGLVALKAHIDGAGFGVTVENLAAFLLSAAKTAGPDAAIARRWYDSSGAHRVDAQYLGLRDEAVRLRRDDKEIVVPLARLSTQDQTFLRLLRPTLMKDTSHPNGDYVQRPVAIADAVEPTAPAPGSRPSVTASEPKVAGRKTKSPPKEMAIELRNGAKLELVLIPAGEFKMGSSDSEEYYAEKPRHRVRITKPFWLGKYPVTQEQWQSLMGNNPSHAKGRKNPVEQVNWNDCQAFLDKLNAKVGGARFHLPSEAQWEYACRAGTKTKYFFGDDEEKLDDYMWHGEDAAPTHPVGGKKPNPWGLYDMYGNVCDWCQDWYEADYYAKSPVDDPPGPATGVMRVFRGSAFQLQAGWCRSALRSPSGPTGTGECLGFRVARVAAEK